MIDNDTDSEKDTEDAPIESLGLRLQRAREYKGLRLDAVAHQLNLSQQRISDMENDEYRFAGAETYAKGYLRSYAKLLGLDPDLIVRDFDRLHYTDTIERHETKLIAKRQISSGDRSMRWVTYSIGLLLIFLVAIWWRSQPNHSVTSAVVTESSDQATTDITSQATSRTETQENQPVEILGEGASSGQKNELQTISGGPVSDQRAAEETAQKPDKVPLPNADLNQKTDKVSAKDAGASQKTSTKTPDAVLNPKDAKVSPAPKTATQSPAAGQTSANTPVKTPAAEDSEETDDSDEDSDADATGTTKTQSWNHIKTFKPKVILSQREQDERALLQELEKVFGRG
jgi:cytoskeleton protein RodZ